MQTTTIVAVLCVVFAACFLPRMVVSRIHKSPAETAHKASVETMYPYIQHALEILSGLPKFEPALQAFNTKDPLALEMKQATIRDGSKWVANAKIHQMIEVTVLSCTHTRTFTHSLTWTRLAWWWSLGCFWRSSAKKNITLPAKWKTSRHGHSFSCQSIFCPWSFITTLWLLCHSGTFVSSFCKLYMPCSHCLE